MSKLVIVESPAKAKTIKRYLGSEYEVKASMGHVRDLFPQRLSVDVKKDFEAKYTIIKGKEKIVKELKESAAKADEVFLATDPDREGEAISWHLASILNLDLDKQNRVKFNEINKTSVKNGLANPDKIDIDLVNAQQARRILDRLVGYRLSPFVSQKIRRGLSAGRVQSVAVRLIVDREEEINAFVPEEYWSITAKLTAPPSRKVLKASFVGDESGKVDLKTKDQVEGYLKRLENASYMVHDIKKGTRRRQPQPPFITSTLQQDASRKLNMPARKAMRIAQELYEGVDVDGYGMIGLITYMRTDSLRISNESREEANTFIRETYGENYLPDKPRFFKQKSASQDGHEAIRPTIPSLTPDKAKGSLTSDQHRLYSLIWNRFMASLMANCVQNTVRVEVRAIGDIDRPANGDKYIHFSMSGYTVKFDGFTVLYESGKDEEENPESLPEMNKDGELRFKELTGDQHFTQPPARYTEASLIKTLEETGVGRPSTYASILTTITSREYVVREKKSLKPTELGTVITNLLKERFPKIVNLKFTAGMESNLDKVEDGSTNYIAMLHDFYGEFEESLKKAKEAMEGVKIKLEEDQTDIVCEKCGRNMVIKVGRFGKFIACPSYPECKNTMSYVEKTDAKCPVCGGDVIGKKTKRGHTFYGCSSYPDCNFMTWDTPTSDLCPECGKHLFKSRGGVIKCLNEPCGYTTKATKKNADNEEDDDQ